MPNLVKTNGTQEVFCKVQKISSADTDVAAGGEVSVMELPAAAIIMTAAFIAGVAFDATATVTVLRKKRSDNTTAETLLSAVAISAVGVDAFTFTGLQVSEPTYLTWDTNIPVTVGSGRLLVTYIAEGRETSKYA